MFFSILVLIMKFIAITIIKSENCVVPAFIMFGSRISRHILKIQNRIFLLFRIIRVGLLRLIVYLCSCRWEGVGKIFIRLTMALLMLFLEVTTTEMKRY